MIADYPPGRTRISPWSSPPEASARGPRRRDSFAVVHHLPRPGSLGDALRRSGRGARRARAGRRAGIPGDCRACRRAGRRRSDAANWGPATARRSGWRSAGTWPAARSAGRRRGSVDAQFTVGRSRPFAGSDARRFVQSSSFWDWTSAARVGSAVIGQIVERNPVGPAINGHGWAEMSQMRRSKCPDPECSGISTLALARGGPGRAETARVRQKR